MTHSNLPWRQVDTTIEDADGNLIIECKHGTEEERLLNARYMAAAANYCNGHPSDGLETATKIGDGLSAMVNRMITRELELHIQRDELLAAIEGYLPYMPNSTAKNGGACGHSEMLKASDRLKDAFAKCTCNHEAHSVLPPTKPLLYEQEEA